MEVFFRSFCFCLMSSDAKSILGTMEVRGEGDYIPIASSGQL